MLTYVCIVYMCACICVYACVYICVCVCVFMKGRGEKIFRLTTPRGHVPFLKYQQSLFWKSVGASDIQGGGGSSSFSTKKNEPKSMHFVSFKINHTTAFRLSSKARPESG